VIEAQLRCLLIHIWRQNHTFVEAAETAGPQLALLRRFRQLVERHFRERLKVADYAAALHSTPDRLHSITFETLGRTPLALIHARCHLEARALLTRTNLSLDQIAAELSFKSTPQFSSFFRKMEGVPPGRYRAAAMAQSAALGRRQELEFSDWP
jgi:AraC family transcriptional activator of pobA